METINDYWLALVRLYRRRLSAGLLTDADVAPLALSVGRALDRAIILGLPSVDVLTALNDEVAALRADLANPIENNEQ